MEGRGEDRWEGVVEGCGGGGGGGTKDISGPSVNCWPVSQSVRSSVDECMTAPFWKSSIRHDRLVS